ncbi:hypothetical protein HDU93_005422 [Gonapodya sp. JEL0774]|nr:hypothetical protein HDU93_005422 [Gonapodya sp. JEL0774]
MASATLAQDQVPSAAKRANKHPLPRSFTIDDVDKLLTDARGLENATVAYKKLEEEVFSAETQALKELDRLQKEYRALLKILKQKRKEHKKEERRSRESLNTAGNVTPNSTNGSSPVSANGKSANGVPAATIVAQDHDEEEEEPLPPITVGGNAEDFEETELWLKAEELKRRLDLAQRDLPQKPGIILQFALGTPTPARIRPHSARLSYKSSYESFKLNMTLISGLFALSSLIFTYSVPGDDLSLERGEQYRFQFKAYRLADLLYMFLLLYYYSVMTIREHVLIVNGSRIRTWWLAHHVVTVVLIGIMLVRSAVLKSRLQRTFSQSRSPAILGAQVWPENRTYSAFRPNFMIYCAYLAIVSYFQYRYQTQRLYTLRALSLAGPMDTAVGEGATGSAGRDMSLLMVLLVIGQVRLISWMGWQVYSGLHALYLWWTVPGATWHVIASGIIFIILGVANFFTTISTYVEKIRQDRRKLLSRERHAERGRHLETLRTRERERSKSRGSREDLGRLSGFQPVSRVGSGEVGGVTRARATFGFTELEDSGGARGRQ